MLEAENLMAGHHGEPVFSGLNLQLNLGEVVALLGPNGCGKTTLLRTLMGLHPASEGQVTFDNRPVNKLANRARARLISYVPQYHRLAFAYPVIDMVTMGVMAGYSEWARPSKEQQAQAYDALAQLGIEDLANRPYTELSGGQRQMVLIARALAQDTPYLFLDEPTNGLDYGNQIRLMQKIRDLAHKTRCIVMTTHHPEQALMAASRVITLQNGEIRQDGSPRAVVTQQRISQLYGLPLKDVPQFGCCIPVDHDESSQKFGWAR